MSAPTMFICPRCGAVSYHPMDAAEGYCGRCHDWTARPNPRRLTPDAIISARATPRLRRLFAVVAELAGVEGVVRRDTPSGTQPYITDDPEVAQAMLALAREASGVRDAYLVVFERVDSAR